MHEGVEVRGEGGGVAAEKSGSPGTTSLLPERRHLIFLKMKDPDGVISPHEIVAFIII